MLGKSEAKPGHFGVPKTTFGIPGLSIPNWDCPGKTGTVGQLMLQRYISHFLLDQPNSIIYVEYLALQTV